MRRKRAVFVPYDEARAEGERLRRQILATLGIAPEKLATIIRLHHKGVERSAIAREPRLGSSAVERFFVWVAKCHVPKTGGKATENFEDNKDRTALFLALEPLVPMAAFATLFGSSTTVLCNVLRRLDRYRSVPETGSPRSILLTSVANCLKVNKAVFFRACKQAGIAMASRLRRWYIAEADAEKAKALFRDKKCACGKRAPKESPSLQRSTPYVCEGCKKEKANAKSRLRYETACATGVHASAHVSWRDGLKEKLAALDHPSDERWVWETEATEFCCCTKVPFRWLIQNNMILRRYDDTAKNAGKPRPLYSSVEMNFIGNLVKHEKGEGKIALEMKPSTSSSTTSESSRSFSDSRQSS